LRPNWGTWRENSNSLNSLFEQPVEALNGPNASSNELKVCAILCWQRSAAGQCLSEGAGDSAFLVVRPARALRCE